MKTIQILASIALWMFGLASYAQEIKIQVVDQDQQEPVPQAYVQNLTQNKTTYTDDNGFFTLTFEKEESIQISISHLGFQIKQVQILPTDNQRVVILEMAQNQLEEVLITGDVFRDPVMNTTTPDLTEKVVQPKNVADLFQDINGFGLIKRGNYAIDPSFRAAQYEQLNIQYDGGTKVMHACPNRMDPITTHVIPEDIAKIEVIKGPYTVRYGATFGGLINMVSKRPEIADYGFSGSASTGYESNGNSMVNMLRLQYASKKFDVVGMYGYRDFGNYEDGAGREIPSSFRSIDYSLRMGYNFSEDERLQLHWRQSFGRDVLHASLPMDSDYDDSSMLSLDYFKKDITDKLVAIKAKTYYSYVDHLMSNSRRSNFEATEASSPVEATTAGGKIELEWDFGKRWTVFSGVDALLIHRDGVRNRLVKQNMMGQPLDQPKLFTDKIWQDSYINDIGVFAEARYKLDQSTLVNFGVRYDNVSSEIQDPEADFNAYYPNLGKRTEHNYSATASLKRLLSKNHSIEFAYGRGVRSANMIERAINHFQVGQDPYEYIGNPNLAAEVNHQFEIGYKGKTELNTFIDRLDWNASVYYSKFENYIVALIDESKDRKYMPNQEPVHPKVFQNLDKAYKTGFEVGFGLQFLNYFDASAQFAYVYSKNEDLNEALPLTPPLRSMFNLSYTNNKFWAGADVRLVSKQSKLASSFGENQTTPAYNLVDFKMGYEIFPGLDLGVAVLNIFDEFYYDHLNFAFRNQANNNLGGMERLTNPGRNFTAFVKYNF